MRLGAYYRTKALDRIGLVPAAGARVLDIGCHDGTLLHHLPGGFRVGVDIRPRRRYSVHYVRADGSRLPFRGDSFDWIFALEVIEHVEMREELVASALRVLKPGGTLLISVPHRGMKIFPAPLTGLVHRLWGHGKGFKGIGEDEIRALIPADEVGSVRFFRWRGRAFLRGFFGLRAAWGLVKPLGRRWALSAVERDARKPEGGDGAYLLFAILQKVAC